MDPLKAKKVRFGYKDTEVLKGLDLTAKTSQIIAVVGKSGSGKTTFLNLVTGVLTAKHEGSITILGRPMALTKKEIGYVPQEISLIPDMTIEENIEFFGNINGIKNAKGRELIETLKLDVPLTRYPTELSGGQRARLNIIVSILHDPQVIILDEPFTGLDYRNRRLLWHFLEHQRNRHKTVILTTHLLTEAEHHATRLVLLHEGKVFAKGRIEDIRRKLRTEIISELKFANLTKSLLADIEEYCEKKGIKILDTYGNYMMIAAQEERHKRLLFSHLEKTDFKETATRRPNLDEIFLGVGE